VTPSLCGVQAKTPEWIDSILVVMRSRCFIGESGRESSHTRGPLSIFNKIVVGS